MIGLLNENRDFLVLGITECIDYKYNVLKLYTPYEVNITIIQFGKVKVNRYGKELEVISSYFP